MNPEAEKPKRKNFLRNLLGRASMASERMVDPDESRTVTLPDADGHPAYVAEVFARRELSISLDSILPSDEKGFLLISTARMGIGVNSRESLVWQHRYVELKPVESRIGNAFLDNTCYTVEEKVDLNGLSVYTLKDQNDLNRAFFTDESGYVQLAHAKIVRAIPLEQSSGTAPHMDQAGFDYARKVYEIQSAIHNQTYKESA